jgi:hypothetical protein
MNGSYDAAGDNGIHYCNADWKLLSGEKLFHCRHDIVY